MVVRIRKIGLAYSEKHNKLQQDSWNCDYREVSWVEEIFGVLTEKLRSRYPKFEFKHSEPAGISCVVWIDALKHGKRVGSAAFVPGDLGVGEIFWKDYSQDSGEYAPGTIGDMNSMNYNEVPVPSNAGLNWMFNKIMK